MSELIGHNQGPAIDVVLAASVEEIRKHLHDDTAYLRERANDLTAMVGGFLADHPTIQDDETLGVAADIVVQCREHLKAIDQRRAEVKRPFIDGGDEIQRNFTAIAHPVTVLVGKVEAEQTAYAKELADRRRRAAEEEAARKAQEAEEAAARAAESLDQDDLLMAQVRAVAAEDAAKAAHSKPANHSRVAGNYGTTASLREKLVVEVTDIALVPPEYRLPDIPKARKAAQEAKVRGEHADFSIPGFYIRWESHIGNYGPRG